MSGQLPELPVPRGDFHIEDPWRVPSGCTLQPLLRSADGAPPRLASAVTAYHDGARLYVLFQTSDEGIVATKVDHDDSLYQEDVVELFLAPETQNRYFEIEINPLGAVFDARVDSPDGDRRTMKVDIGWQCTGLQVAIRRTWENDRRFLGEVLTIVPFAALDAAVRSGTSWFANFYRIDRAASGDEFTAWSPTGRTPPDFHVPARFGRLVFL
ncbi:MAG: carbohydrate-binding family 9-like protein [Thermoanaerobaculia bacterium]